MRWLWNSGLSLAPQCGLPLERFEASWEDESINIVGARLRDVTETHALNRRVFDQWLRNEAANAGAVVLDSIRGLRVEESDGHWRVRVRTNRAETLCTTPLIVEATGRRARSICQPNVTRHYTDRLVGVSVDFAKSFSVATQAVVEASNDGWWYFLGVRGRRPFACFFCDVDDVPRTECPAAFLGKQLRKTQYLRRLVGDLLPSQRVLMWDARTSVRSAIWRGGWLAIGDAAWSMDPLSGSGVERAIYSGVSAAHAALASMTESSLEPLRDCAINQVNAFNGAAATQSRVYSNVKRFKSRFWARRAAVG